ncbi:hypothetical protein Taro_009113 [Colocasia esculenta]|uniref:Uncharacterized protein n=1 Tax=Colocasia esculenta TaxID=4460 RepID=A0A843TZF7_COLES|nr:hypothetical protein [Colocasia esculenta]
MGSVALCGSVEVLSFPAWHSSSAWHPPRGGDSPSACRTLVASGQSPRGAWSEEEVHGMKKMLSGVNVYGRDRLGVATQIATTGYVATFIIRWLTNKREDVTLSVWSCWPVLLEVFTLRGSGWFCCGPSTLWRFEVAVHVVRRPSHFLLLWLVRDWLSLLGFDQEAHPPTLFRLGLAVAGVHCRTVVVAVGSTLFEFIAYLTSLNSNPSRSLNPWVAARPLGSLAGVWEVGSLQVYGFPAISSCELRGSCCCCWVCV